MKRLLLFLIVPVCMAAAAACNAQEKNPARDPAPSQTAPQTASGPGKIIPPFSFAEDSREYTEGMPGVKTEGFVNTDEKKITGKPDAEERAKNECTVEWDTVETFYDSEAEIWEVHFCKHDYAGGGESVYLDKNGKTLLIVYGE